MLNYALYMQIHGLLAEISPLTSKLYASSGSFAAACLVYFNRLQAFADEHKLYISSDIAIATEKLLVYKGEPSAAPGVAVGRKNPRKEKDAYAVACLDGVRREIKAFLEKEIKTYGECSDIWRQVVARLLCKRRDFVSVPVWERAEAVFTAVQADPELIPYYSHVTGLIGVFNAKALLDTILPQLGL
ncbi:MAG: hypothetical protein LBT55_04760 [Clostridiaceae bacterium]|jgi:hypothetical protein|nr:hypothetical protein [Clostridiaceae bacterium]